jgi:signal peptidase
MMIGYLRDIGNALVTIAFVAVIILTLLITLPGVIGAEDTYVVRSGSMSPSIQSGDIVVVESVSSDDIERGDVITFQRDSRSTTGDRTKRITHRVVAINDSKDGLRFYTKGDANEERDLQPVAASQIVGKVWFSVPLVGWGVAFANTNLGRILLLVVPGLLLVVSELYTLFTESSDSEQ